VQPDDDGKAAKEKEKGNAKVSHNTKSDSLTSPSELKTVEK